MARETGITWCDSTMNFWTGCTKVSPGCKNCYAENWAKASGRPHLWKGARERTKDWRGPPKWNREAFEAGIRQKVFTNSLSDFFDNQADATWRASAWHMIKSTPSLDWLILTKRPQNIADMLPPDWTLEGYPNVWLGVTAENQEEFNRRVPLLIGIPAVVHFISAEPLLGPIDMREWIHFIQWVIVGGESGTRNLRRDMDLAWAYDIKDQCARAGVPFFGKQLNKVQPLPDDLDLHGWPSVGRTA